VPELSKVPVGSVQVPVWTELPLKLEPDWVRVTEAWLLQVIESWLSV
jgi:hypothetical protein